MYYTEGGEPLAAEADTSLASVAAYRRIADPVWAQAKPFEQWWAANQQFHRGLPGPYGSTNSPPPVRGDK